MVAAALRARTAAVSADEFRTSRQPPRSCRHPWIYVSWAFCFSRLFLYAGESRSSGIFRIELGKLPQNFFGSLVPHRRHNNLHGDNLVAAGSFVGCRGNSLAAHPQLLTTLRPRRNF